MTLCSTDLEDGGDSNSSERERALGKLAFGEEEYEALVAEVKDVIGELARDRDDTLVLDIHNDICFFTAVNLFNFITCKHEHLLATCIAYLHFA